MPRNFLAGDFLAHAVTFGDFMAGYFFAGDFLGGYHAPNLLLKVTKVGYCYSQIAHKNKLDSFFLLNS